MTTRTKTSQTKKRNHDFVQAVEPKDLPQLDQSHNGTSIRKKMRLSTTAVDSGSSLGSFPLNATKVVTSSKILTADNLISTEKAANKSERTQTTRSTDVKKDISSNQYVENASLLQHASALENCVQALQMQLNAVNGEKQSLAHQLMNSRRVNINIWQQYNSLANQISPASNRSIPLQPFQFQRDNLSNAILPPPAHQPSILPQLAKKRTVKANPNAPLQAPFPLPTANLVRLMRANKRLQNHNQELERLLEIVAFQRKEAALELSKKEKLLQTLKVTNVNYQQTLKMSQQEGENLKQQLALWIEENRGTKKQQTLLQKKLDSVQATNSTLNETVKELNDSVNLWKQHAGDMQLELDQLRDKLQEDSTLTVHPDHGEAFQQLVRQNQELQQATSEEVQCLKQEIEDMKQTHALEMEFLSVV